MRGLILIIGVVVGVLAGSTPVSAQGVNWGQKSALLQTGMTEQQVITTVGYRPTKVEMKTCGTQSRGGAWRCKLYTFGDLFNGLVVYFQETRDGIWLVNGWDVYP